MASVTPRASGFWSDTPRMSYFGDDAEDMENQSLVEECDENDGRTPLDRTIDRIGMGSYQWTLLSLCGFGWMADNMWIQAVAIILPRVQQHYSVPDSYIGTVSSSMFAGMMFGAVGWGTCSDLMGRSTAFNATLFFTALFGLLASLANSFFMLCLLLFFLGSAVGGSMPTDGTLLLEHMPNGKQYLVTALSVFFSFGAVFSAVVALLTVPQHSCPPAPAPCDVGTQNQGWKYMLITLGLITLSMFIARIVFFRLHESPRYLVHAGRHQEALESLQMISRFNGSELNIHIEDVHDSYSPPASTTPPDPQDIRAPFLRAGIPDSDNDTTPTSRTIFDVDDTVHSRVETLRDESSSAKHYHSTSESPNSLDSHSFVATSAGHIPPGPGEAVLTVRSQTYQKPTATIPALKSLPSPPPLPLPPSPPLRPPRPRPTLSGGQSHTSLLRRRSSLSPYGVPEKASRILPRWVRRPLWAWLERVAMVLSPEWLRTTLLMWAAWFAMSLAYTMFNVFLPKLLESRSSLNERSKTLEDSLWDVVIFTLGGCPGAIVGAYLIDSPLGRRWSLAGSTFLTAAFCVLFALVESPMAVRVSTVGVSLSATAMYAVLYGWTPEIFGTKVRGTACGIASALSRIGGMIAPLLGGTLLMLDHSFPVYTSVIIFAVAGICVLFLRETPPRESGERVVVH